jgi:hypothetical protein
MVGDAFIKIINHDGTGEFIASHFGIGYNWLLYLHRLLYKIQGFPTTVVGAFVKDTNLMAVQECHHFIFWHWFRIG